MNDDGLFGKAVAFFGIFLGINSRKNSELSMTFFFHEYCRLKKLLLLLPFLLRLLPFQGFNSNFLLVHSMW